MALRIAQQDRVSPDVVSRISVVISEKLKSFGELKAELHGGPRSVAEILNRMDASVSDQILSNMQDEQPPVDAIRYFMFTSPGRLDGHEGSGCQGRSQAAGGRAQGHQRSDEAPFPAVHVAARSEMMREDMEAVGPVKIRDVEGAQQEILAVVRQLENEGVLSLKGGGGDQYVV